MARPKIGIFGALVALGGFLAVRHMQRNRAAQAQAARELSRWEGEGGTVATSAAPQAGWREITVGGVVSMLHCCDTDGVTYVLGSPNTV